MEAILRRIRALLGLVSKADWQRALRDIRELEARVINATDRADEYKRRVSMVCAYFVYTAMKEQRAPTTEQYALAEYLQHGDKGMRGDAHPFTRWGMQVTPEEADSKLIRQ